MTKFEFAKLDLTHHDRGGDDIDHLCALGQEGWYIAGVLPNGVAYLERVIEEDEAAQPKPRSAELKVWAPPTADELKASIKQKSNEAVLREMRVIVELAKQEGPMRVKELFDKARVAEPALTYAAYAAFLGKLGDLGILAKPQHGMYGRGTITAEYAGWLSNHMAERGLSL